MRNAIILLGLLLASCGGIPGGGQRFDEAQLLVDRTVAKHRDIVRLTIHAIPTGGRESRIIACNIREKIGQRSDPEDLAAMESGKIIVLREGTNLDVTAPLVDGSGKPIAATGITLRFPVTAKEPEVVAKAKAIADELSTSIQQANRPLW